MPSSTDWLIENEKGWVLRVWVNPHASKTEFLGFHEGATGSGLRLKIKIAAVPEKGKANDALILVISNTLRCHRRQVRLLRGATSAYKDFLLLGMAPEKIRAALGPKSTQATID